MCCEVTRVFDHTAKRLELRERIDANQALRVFGQRLNDCKFHHTKRAVRGNGSDWEKESVLFDGENDVCAFLEGLGIGGCGNECAARSGEALRRFDFDFGTFDVADHTGFDAFVFADIADGDFCGTVGLFGDNRDKAFNLGAAAFSRLGIFFGRLVGFAVGVGGFG